MLHEVHLIHHLCSSSLDVITTFNLVEIAHPSEQNYNNYILHRLHKVVEKKKK